MRASSQSSTSIGVAAIVARPDTGPYLTMEMNTYNHQFHHDIEEVDRVPCIHSQIRRFTDRQRGGLHKSSEWLARLVPEHAPLCADRRGRSDDVHVRHTESRS